MLSVCLYSMSSNNVHNGPCWTIFVPIARFVFIIRMQRPSRLLVYIFWETVDTYHFCVANCIKRLWIPSLGIWIAMDNNLYRIVNSVHICTVKCINKNLKKIMKLARNKLCFTTCSSRNLRKHYECWLYIIH